MILVMALIKSMKTALVAEPVLMYVPLVQYQRAPPTTLIQIFVYAVEPVLMNVPVGVFMFVKATRNGS